MRQVIIDTKQYLAVKDAIKVICSTTGKHARETWRTLDPAFKAGLKEHLNTFDFHGPGGSEMPDVITFQGLIILCMYLPGPCAKRNRRAVADVVLRCFAGDKRLIEEIIGNSESEEPVARVAAIQTEEEQLRIQILRADLAFKEGMVRDIEASTREKEARTLAIELGIREKEAKTRAIEETRMLRKHKAILEMQAESRTIARNPNMTDVEKTEAISKVRSMIKEVKGSNLEDVGFFGDDKDFENNLSFFLVKFLEQASQDSKFTVVAASKLFEAYQLFEVKYNIGRATTGTRFGMGVKKMEGVIKRRSTSGWLYRLDHAQLRACAAAALP